jgi:hypothetical protein
MDQVHGAWTRRCARVHGGLGGGVDKKRAGASLARERSGSPVVVGEDEEDEVECNTHFLQE